MASRKGPMDESTLAAQVRQEIDAARSFDRSELSNRRSKAIEYFQGEMTDVPSQPNRSSVTARTIAEIMGWLMPGVMRVFTAGDEIADFQPETPEDVDSARQATQYINFLFMRDCDGEKVLYDAIFEGFLHGNGIIKTWWDTSPEYRSHSYTGLSEDAYALLVQDDEVSILQQTETLEEMQGPDGMPVQVVTYDCKIRRTVTKGRLRVMCVAPEEYLIKAGSTDIEDANFHCHRFEDTRESLIAQGYDKEKVMAIGIGTELDTTEEKMSRFEDEINDFDARDSDDLQAEVEVFECYMKVDFDGDGHSEWRRIVMGGSAGSSSVLENEEWGDDHPFVDLVPMPRPHRWDGRSIYDEAEDLQRINTVLLRQTLDNLYMTNNPRQVARENMIANPDALDDMEIGTTIWTKADNAFGFEGVPLFAEKSFSMLEYMEAIGEKRTGVSRQSMSLDPETLQNQTATASNNAMTAAYGKQELYARNIARGLRRLFRKMLKLVTENQDQPRMIRLRDEFVPMDPRVWNSNMDSVVTVGLGSGSRERDLQMLMTVSAEQKMIIQTMGVDNPVVTPKEYVTTLHKMVEAAGLKSPEMFFREVDEQAMQAMAQKANQPDPKIAAEQAKAQADMQIEQAKMQQQGQMDQARMQFDQQKAAAQMRADQELQAARLQQEEMRAQRDMEMKREQLVAEMGLKREQLAAELQLKRESMAAELALKRELGAMNASVKASQGNASSSVRMGGDPG